MRLFISLLCGLIFSTPLMGQLVINEASNSNAAVFVQPNGSTPDWIELYNGSPGNYSLQGHYLSDDRTHLQKWPFPPNTLSPHAFLTVLADKNNSSFLIHHYETAVGQNNLWKYHIPTGNVPQWDSLGFDDASWMPGKMSIGFGDGDDSTVLAAPVTTYYARYAFQVTHYQDIEQAILDIDYDDGFVAYLNGTEIARSGLVGVPPAVNELATDHEAQLYQGGSLTSFDLNMGVVANLLVNGTNVLAIEVHNSDSLGDDLSCRPFLTFGLHSNQQQFGGTTHPYFQVANQGGGTFETNFGIATEGETLYLSNAGVILDSLVVPDLEANMSIGRNQDGAGPVVVFTSPTPNTSNNVASGYSGYESLPIIQQIGGVYHQPIQVFVTNTSTHGGILRYTLHGNDPDTNSTVYTGPILLDTHAVVKVRCFPNGTNLLPSPLEAETFLFNESSTIPMVAITIDSNDLVGGNGIFDNWWTDWKRPCVIEYFDTTGTKRFESKASVKPDGGAGGSRSNPQHSVTVEPANSAYGTGMPIHFPIIPEKPYVNDYYGLYIRNGSNWWNQYHQRDATFCRTMKNTHVNYQGYQPANVFINGVYFGVYELREKASEGYYLENYGNNMDSLDLLSVSYWYGAGIIRTVKGSDTSFYSMVHTIDSLDKNDPNYLKYCDRKLDVKNYADYLIGEFWIANTDWIWNNMKMARTRSTDNKWRFNLLDLEWGLGGWTDYNADMFNHFFYGNQPNPYYQIYANLIQDSTYRNYFINRFADLMNTNLHPNTTNPMVNRMYQELLPEMPRHFALWTGDVAGGMATYNDRKNTILYHFNRRSSVVRQQMKSYYNLTDTVVVTLNTLPSNAGYIKISTIIPDSLPWKGVYFNGNPVRISAHANPGFTFDHWEYNINLPAAQQHQSSVVVNLASDDYFTAVFQGTRRDTTITVSEIQYNPDPSVDGGNWIELHNYGNQPIDLTGYRIQSNKFFNQFAFKDGTEIPANGYLVVAEDSIKFKNLYPGITNWVGSTHFGWNNTKDSIYLIAPNRKAVIAMHYTNNRPYPRCANGYGRTMENRIVNQQQLDSTVWFCGCIGGSPGKAYTPCKEDLIISEFNLGKKTVLNNSDDWIELKNNTSSTMNLSGFRLKDENNWHHFPLDGITLEPQEYAVIVKDSSLFNTRHLALNAKLIYGISFGISNNDAIRVFNQDSVLIQSVFIDTLGSWPSSPFNEDYTFEYRENGTNQTLGQEWFQGCSGGSPGKAYSPCPELPENTSVTLYPNPTTGSLTLTCLNQGIVSYALYDTYGQQLMEEELPKSMDPIVSYTLDVSRIAQGHYIMMVNLNGDRQIIRFIKR